MFINCALKKMTGMFNLTVKKGHFPHFFSRVSRLNYVGQIPPKEDFDLRRLSATEQADFDQWYEEKKKHQYDFAAEYWNTAWTTWDCCREGAMAFRELFMTANTLCPFSNGHTLASICQMVWCFIKNKTFLPRCFALFTCLRTPLVTSGRTPMVEEQITVLTP